MTLHTPPFDRILAGVTKAAGPMETPCWVPNLVPTRYGYTRISDRGRSRSCHRVVYEAMVGPVPDGLCLDHLCRNRSCVNPQHLEPVTMRENLLRGFSPSSINAHKTHCHRGHEFTPENTKISSSTGKRNCRTCIREGARRRRDDAVRAYRAAWGRADRARKRAAV